MEAHLDRVVTELVAFAQDNPAIFEDPSIFENASIFEDL